MHDLSALPFTIPSLHSAYQGGVAPGDILAECYRRIAAVDDPGIFIHLIDQEDCAAAIAALGTFDPVAKPLWGVPFVVKDNIDAAAIPTTAACPVYAYTPAKDAFVVRLLRQAGAILIGKTNLDQFATGLVGVRSPYQPPRNAFDPDIVPGGSSSGSAVSVSHGFVAFGLGTDTAGSGRVPAALNNIVGLKPTLGTLSATGVVPACRSLDTISVFALTVDDAYIAFEVANKFDAEDSFARRFPAKPITAPPPSLTIGVPSAASIKFMGDDIQRDSFHAAIGSLRTLGAQITELDFTPFYEIAQLLYDGSWIAERFTVIEDLLKDRPDDIHPVTRAIVGRATDFSAADAFQDQYKLAALKRVVEPILDSVDAMCVPTIPTFYSVADLEADPIQPNSYLGTYTNFVNLIDLCGIAVPVSRRKDGRPGSVTLLARAGLDGFIAGVARRLHQQADVLLGATKHPVPEVAQPSRSTGDDEIELLVCGAHMSGLPLNHQLTDLGARLLRETRTSAQYTLFSLPEASPPRPALVRAKRGRMIEVEIWAMPSSALGRFISNVPEPLGIGTVTLEDGSTVKGFICESIGLKGAIDITHTGGWRSFLSSCTVS
ncbi:allophanate hydrolase [Roseovarius sp. CAU 1744]|uniref:allophanate hydrolase n=1 Tax=Roseovarius sp. CAU 1744 TaxID=3140368 RepID=UPI00325BA83A